MKTPMKKIVVLTLLTSLVSGCATTGQSGMSQTQYPQGGVAAEQDPCAVGSSALLGALMDGKRGAARGAAAGGIVAALGCVAINSQSRQTRTAAQVDNDFIRTRGRLPAEPQVVSYQPRLNASTVQRGKPVVVNSTVELVNGATTPVMQVREELVVFDQDGKQFKSGSKALTNNSGGRFENSFEITLPKDASQGRYALRTNLYVNGKLSASRDLNTQLVWSEVGQLTVASR
jgi:hypothetical protein